MASMTQTEETEAAAQTARESPWRGVVRVRVLLLHARLQIVGVAEVVRVSCRHLRRQHELSVKVVDLRWNLQTDPA